MAGNTLVSVVIPAFNAGAHIGAAIESVLRQTHRKLEVLVIDDGSTDDTEEAVKAIVDSRIKYIYQSNAGQSAAINAGVRYSSGECIKLLDADDWLNATHIESQLTAIGESEDRVASSCWGYFVDDPRKVVIRNEYTNRSYDDPLEWLVDSLTQDEGMMGGWMWLIPRKLWEQSGGYDESLSLNNDFHFSVQLLLSSNGVCFADAAFYSYRKGVSGALSGITGKRAMESAYLTTFMGTDLLLNRERSRRIEKIAADRFKFWTFKFYPSYPELVEKSERRIEELGGSDLEMQGGKVFSLLSIILGWKQIRWLQYLAYHLGWQQVLERKSQKRLSRLVK